MNESTIQIIVAVLLFAFTAYKVWNLVKQSRKINASKEWPLTPAQVVNKEVQTHRSTKGGTTYYPEVRYKYTVLGTEFTQSTRLNGLWSRNSAQKVLDEFGDRMEIRYNPENPKEHTTGYEKIRISDILLVLVMLGLAVFTLVLQFTK
jgi:hypothetical protein